MRSFFSLPPQELEELLSKSGSKSFHLRSVRDWILRRGALDFSQMTDLPQALRESIAKICSPVESKVVEQRKAPDGTVKLLLELRDGEKIETVVMPGTRGHTICVSTQVGCPVACRFCASGSLGVVRNLDWWEILEQFLHGRAVQPFQRVVVMGIGEPTLNLENLLKALSSVSDLKGFGIGARKITISTVGYPERIQALAQSGKPYNLAVSLHAPDDKLRSEIIPTMKKVKLDQIIEAGKEYFEKTGREVTYEYVLLAGVNDLSQHAQALARKLRGTRSTVNLIPYNPIPNFPYKRPSEAAVRRFSEILRDAHIPATVRWSKGVEADAACGQLRIQSRDKDETLTRGGSAG